MTCKTHFDSWLNPAPIVIHIRFAGFSFDLPLTTLDIGTATADQRVKTAVATRLMITPDRLDDHVIDRHGNGDLTIRPERLPADRPNHASPRRRRGLFSGDSRVFRKTGRRRCAAVTS